MRYAFSVVLTLVGLTAFYLFASGSLVSADGIWSLESVGMKALSPFLEADSFALLILSVGVGCFASGVVLVPRTTVHIASKSRSDPSHSELQRFFSDFSGEKLLETALVINVLVVAAITSLLGIVLVQDYSSATLTLGSLLLIALVQVVIGLILNGVLFAKKKTWARRRKAPFSLSAGLNLLEAVMLTVLLFLGYL